MQAKFLLTAAGTSLVEEHAENVQIPSLCINQEHLEI